MSVPAGSSRSPKVPQGSPVEDRLIQLAGAWVAAEVWEATVGEGITGHIDSASAAFEAEVATVRAELGSLTAQVERLTEERDELERDRDSWVDQCDDARRFEAKAHAEVSRLAGLLEHTTEGLRRLADADGIKQSTFKFPHEVARGILAVSSRPPGDTEDEPWESFASSQGGIFNGPHPADEGGQA